MASAKRVSREEYEHLCRMIQRWNENRVELFGISKPNEVSGVASWHDITYNLLHPNSPLLFNTCSASNQVISCLCIQARHLSPAVVMAACEYRFHYADIELEEAGFVL